ncbi:MAG: type II toxin-antitoxin system VapC family toxin [Sandaracinaceae bacterium]|nr:type II toxin-antitoxin system VapC family toxin [Sandaracinaceae bacterium]
MIVADTDVLIDALRGKGAADRMRIEIATGTLATTTISVFELLSGAKSDKERRAVEALLGALTTLPVDDRGAREAASIRRELEAAGSTIATADTLIAGICRSRNAILLTRNRAHFERVRGLSLATLSA